MSNQIEVIVKTLADLIDGQPFPAEDSEAVFHLAEAIRTLQAANAPRDYEILGLKALGLVIDRAISDFATKQALRNLGARE